MAFTAAQIAQLLRPINTRRVLQDGKSKSHISQQDARAHLTRVFGFGAWDLDIIGPDLVFEEQRLVEKKPTGRWDICYRAKARLTIRNPQGREVCHYEGSATATAQNQTRGEAHGLALRSAESLALKRCAINLGDQFGLSLYNKGQVAALVGALIVKPVQRGKDDPGDVQTGIPEQVSLGNEEGEHIGDGPPLNKDGSLSRSRMTDEELIAAGAMTRGEVRAHGALVREVTKTEPAEREDLWTQGPPPPEEVAKYSRDVLTRAQRSKLMNLLGNAGWTAREDQMRAAGTLVGRVIDSITDLTREEAKAVIDVLDILAKSPDPAVALTDYVAATKAGDLEEMRRLLKGGAAA